MKRLVILSCLTLMFCLAGKMSAQTAGSSSSGNAQNQLELRQMKAFRGQTEEIPYQPSGLSAYTDLSKKMDFAVKMRPLSENAALQKAFKANRRKGMEKASTADLAIDTTLSIAYWGVLTSAEDGKQLFVTMEYTTPSPSSWYLNGVTYTLFDENLKPGKSFSLKTSARTQDITLMASYSTRFFNYTAQKEFLISVHGFAEDGTTGPASCRDTLLIVDEDGKILRKFGHTSGALLHSVTKDGSTENRVQLIDAFYSDLADTMKTFIYRAMDVMQDNPEPLFTFYIDEDLTTYANGALAAFSEIEGEPCYVTTQYEKPFVADDNHSGDEIIVEKDNRFELYIYDVDFQLRKKITLPLIGLDENEFSFSTLMYFGKYMITRHVFNNDDKYEIIYAMDRYDISCDCNKLQFYLMDEDGNILKEIADEVASVTELQAIRGENDEFALCLGDEDAVTGISMLDIPSLEINFHFPALYKNELLSMNFERVPAENGGYNYVFGLGRGESADGTVYGGIIYYDRQGNAVKRHRIDLGEDCLLFTPIINPLTMNPYAFIPDEKQEYLYFYRFSKNDAAGRGFGIANEEETLYKWQDNAQDGTFSSAGVLTNENTTELKNLYITWEGASTKHVFYRLPLKGIELQGEGTQASPYIITTPGELDLVRNYPEAWFILGNDIDMASFTGVNMQGFNSIPVFKGNFDGKGHFIENIIINGNGIFKNVEGGTIANLSMRNVAFSSTGRADVGAIAGSLMMESKVTNCHVESDIVVSSDRVGGLVGQAVNASVIDRCSFTGHISGSSESVGGIAGDLRTSGTVQNSYVKGSVAGKENVGGIVGSMLNGAVVENSYSQASVYASAYMAGGIVGENNGAHVRRTYATGKVEVDTLFESEWSKGTAGGLAGYTIPNKFAGQIKYSFALNDTVIAPQGSYRVASTEYYVSSDTVKSLDSNFALAAMKIGPKNALATINNDSCVMDRNHGQSGTLETFNQAFYEQYTWQFGDNASAPWKMTGDKPTLWWEKRVRGVTIFPSRVTVPKGETVPLEANMIPQDAENTALIWSSADVRVATVTSEGLVTGNNSGRTTITVKTVEGGFTATCEVTVVIPVEEVLFAEKEIVVEPSTTKHLDVTVLPEDATNKNVLYFSLNPAIAITGGPNVYGVEPGETKLVAVSEDGRASDTCTVYVRSFVTDIVLTPSNVTLNKETPTVQLTVKIYPEEAEGAPLVWESQEPKVATVSSAGLVSAGVKGQTTISVASQDGGAVAYCLVTVTEDVDLAAEEFEAGKMYACLVGTNIEVSASYGMEWVRLYNVAGLCVASMHVGLAEKATIPAAHLPKGIYLLRAGLADGHTAVAKVIR